MMSNSLRAPTELPPRATGLIELPFTETKSGGLLLVGELFRTNNPYGFPGGSIDPHESPEQAVIRELEEELALKTVALKRVCERIDPRNRVHHVFAVKVTGDVTLDPRELGGIGLLELPERHGNALVNNSDITAHVALILNGQNGYLEQRKRLGAFRSTEIAIPQGGLKRWRIS